MQSEYSTAGEKCYHTISAINASWAVFILFRAQDSLLTLSIGFTLGSWDNNCKINCSNHENKSQRWHITEINMHNLIKADVCALIFYVIILCIHSHTCYYFIISGCIHLHTFVCHCIILGSTICMTFLIIFS